MSLIPLMLPIQIAAIVEDARRELRQQDKALAADLGFASAADYSKAKHGVRPFDWHRIARGPIAVQRALVKHWSAALDAEEQTPPVVSDRDLVADLIGRVDELLAVVGRRQIKAELRDERDERRSA